MILLFPQLVAAQEVTVAAVVMNEQADGSSWDLTKGADIVLCGDKGCYVSNGLEQPATFYQGTGAFRLFKKAGECRDALKCVFRGVDLKKLHGSHSETGLKIQLVDVDYVSHHYMNLAAIKGPSKCSLLDGRLLCADGVHKRDYSLWVIEEKIAQKAGVAGLDYAVFKSVQAQRNDELIKRLDRLRQQLKASVAGFYKLVLNRDISQRCISDTKLLVETFYVMGLADAEKRRAEYILREFIGRQPSSNLAGLIRNKPQLYWAFFDIAEQFKKFSTASLSELDLEPEDIRVVKIDGRAKLKFGKLIETRAKTAVKACEAQAMLPEEG